MTTETATTIADVLDRMAEELGDSATPIVLRDKAQEIVDDVRRDDPDTLIDYFEEHAVTLLGQQLRMRLARTRRLARRSVFGTGAEHNEDEALPPDPWMVKLACEGDIWKPVGEMTRPDWRFIAEERKANARASLFDVALANAMVRKLPNDKVKTRDAVSLGQFEKLQRSAEQKAHDVLQKI